MRVFERLQLTHDPFARCESAAQLMPPARAAFEQILCQIRLKNSAVVLEGPAGTGKTLLLRLLEQACAKGEPSADKNEPHLANASADDIGDLVLIDEADSVTPSTLTQLISDAEDSETRTIVLACRQFPEEQFREFTPPIVRIAKLSDSDARTHVMECLANAGRPDLFTPDALDALLAAASGSPGMIRSIGGSSLVLAANGEGTQVTRDQVLEAMATHGVVRMRRPISLPVISRQYIPPTERNAKPVDALLISDAAEAEHAEDVVSQLRSPISEILTASLPLARSAAAPVLRVLSTRLGTSAAFGALFVLGWISVPLLSSSSVDDWESAKTVVVTPPAKKAAVTPRAVIQTRASELDAMEKVAAAVLSRSTILLITPLPLPRFDTSEPARTTLRVERRTTKRVDATPVTARINQMPARPSVREAVAIGGAQQVASPALLSRQPAQTPQDPAGAAFAGSSTAQ